MEELVAGSFFPWVVLILLLINTGAFLLIWWDKVQSRRSGAERISEGLLFFMATAFGSVGVFLGMNVFRHKTRKWYFLFGIPFLMLQNFSFLYLVFVQLFVP